MRRRLTARARRLEMIELTGWGARALIWSYWATMAGLMFWTIDEVREPVPSYVAIVILAAVALALSLDTADQLSMGVTLFVIAAGVTNCLLVSWQLLQIGYAQWFLGAATIGLFFLCLRGRILWAWIGYVLICAVTVSWGLTSEIGLAASLLALGRQLPVVLIGTLFATGLRRTGDDIERLTTESTRRAADEAATVATAREREERLVALGELATPMLERLASGAPITDVDRLEYALAEAELRDGLRAPSLVLPDVSAAARSARRRGVEVVLLDDSDPGALSAGDLARAATRISALINATTDGRVTARLLPSGRDSIATIVVDGEEHLSEQVPVQP